jgi:hypothetical protein
MGLYPASKQRQAAGLLSSAKPANSAVLVDACMDPKAYPKTYFRSGMVQLK